MGLVTGRRLWFRAHQSQSGEDVFPLDPSVLAAGDGQLVLATPSGWLTLLRLSDGSTIWERNLRGESIGHVWLTNDRVVTADPWSRRVNILERRSGRLVERVLFTPSSPQQDHVFLVLAEDRICGPTSNRESEGVKAIDLATGKTAWRATLEKPINTVFKPGKEYFGVGLPGGDVKIFRTDSGDPVLDYQQIPAAETVTHAALVDGTLLMQHSVQNNPYPSLTALDVATGDILWRRDAVVVNTAQGQPLRIIGGRVLTGFVEAARQQTEESSVKLIMIDIDTGEVSGSSVSLEHTQGMGRASIESEFHPVAGTTVISTGHAIQAFRIEASDSRQTHEGL